MPKTIEASTVNELLIENHVPVCELTDKNAEYSTPDQVVKHFETFISEEMSESEQNLENVCLVLFAIFKAMGVNTSVITNTHTQHKENSVKYLKFGGIRVVTALDANDLIEQVVVGSKKAETKMLRDYDDEDEYWWELEKRRAQYSYLSAEQFYKHVFPNHLAH